MENKVKYAIGLGILGFIISFISIFGRLIVIVGIILSINSMIKKRKYSLSALILNVLGLILPAGIIMYLYYYSLTY